MVLMPLFACATGPWDQDEVVRLISSGVSRYFKARSIEGNCDCVGLGHGIDPDGLSAAIEFLARYLPA